MKSALRTLALVLIFVAAAAGGYWLYRAAQPAQAAAQAGGVFTQTTAVQRGDLQASISVVGELYAPQNETLAFDRLQDSTELLSLAVETGQMVAAGQVLATVDPTPYQQALDQARSDLQAAEKKLADLRTPATDLEIAQADLAVARAELALQQAQDHLDDLLAPAISDLRSQVSDAQLALAEAQQSLAELQADTTTEERIQTLKETEADRSAEYTRIAGENYSDAFYQDRLRVAYNKLLDAQDARITAEVQQQESLLKAQQQVTHSEQQLAGAQEALADALAGGDEMDLAMARQNVAQAETDVAGAREKRAELDEGADAAALAAAQADVDKKRLVLTEAEADLAGATLAAPFAGTVLRVNVSPGDRVNAGTAILTLANLDDLQVVASIDETTIRQVAAGQSVQITFDAFPGQTFAGEVLSVPLQGALQGDVMVYDVPISLRGAEALPLRVGMTANAAIAVGQATGALLVPTMALQNVGGFYQVLVADSRDATAEPQAVPVEIGLSNGVYTQVVRGLNEGDEVVVLLQSEQSASDFRALRQIVGGSGGPGGGRPPGDRN